MRKVPTDKPSLSIPFEQSLDEKTQLIRVLLDALPCVALVLSPDREVMLSNEEGRRIGALPGTKCYATWGQREEPCTW